MTEKRTTGFQDFEPFRSAGIPFAQSSSSTPSFNSNSNNNSNNNFLNNTNSNSNHGFAIPQTRSGLRNSNSNTSHRSSTHKRKRPNSQSFKNNGSNKHHHNDSGSENENRWGDQNDEDAFWTAIENEDTVMYDNVDADASVEEDTIMDYDDDIVDDDDDTRISLSSLSHHHHQSQQQQQQQQHQQQQQQQHQQFQLQQQQQQQQQQQFQLHQQQQQQQQQFQLHQQQQQQFQLQQQLKLQQQEQQQQQLQQQLQQLKQQQSSFGSPLRQQTLAPLNGNNKRVRSSDSVELVELDDEATILEPDDSYFDAYFGDCGSRLSCGATEEETAHFTTPENPHQKLSIFGLPTHSPASNSQSEIGFNNNSPQHQSTSPSIYHSHHLFLQKYLSVYEDISLTFVHSDGQESSQFHQTIVLEALLGSGSFSDVYKAKSITNASSPSSVFNNNQRIESDSFAIKILKPHIHRHKSFQREVSAMVATRSIPGTVDILAYRGAPHYWILMPWMKGGSLSSLILHRRQLNQPLTLDETLYISLQIVATMQALHERCVLHRDLTPENVLLTTSLPSNNSASSNTTFEESLRVTLGDFGLAEVINFNNITTPATPNANSQSNQAMNTASSLSNNSLAMTSNNASFEISSAFQTVLQLSPNGNPRYRAPEVTFGFYAFSAEIYNFGSCLYEMLTGHKPLEEVCDANVGWMISRGLRPIQPSDYFATASGKMNERERILGELVQWCCSNQPTARPHWHQIFDVLQRLYHNKQ